MTAEDGSTTDAQHRPGEPIDGSALEPADQAVGEAADSAVGRPRQVPASDTFGWQGWVLVLVLVGALLVVPIAILFLPQAKPVLRSLGLTLRDAYLTLPMLPAIVLGATAVWASLRSRAD